MIELPEALARARELREAVAGKRVSGVLPPSSPHKFCWYNGEPEGYGALLSGRRTEGAEGFGIFVEIAFEGGARLCVNDGVNLRLLPDQSAAPKKHQLLILFEDGAALAFTVAMYGGIICHQGGWDNEYYRKSRQSLSPLDPGYDRGRFEALWTGAKPTLSAKALLATQQRIPGVGNGVLQDILFTAGVHPKRKAGSLGPGDRDRLFASLKGVLQEMADKGGRDTERDIYGRPGGYPTLLSKNTLAGGCPRCGGAVTKEAYLGGAVYYCPRCQPLAAE